VAVLLEDVIPAHPGEEIPIADLVMQLALARLTREAGARGAIPIHTAKDEITDLACMDAVYHVDVARG
jgi:hypothetical protein